MRFSAAVLLPLLCGILFGVACSVEPPTEEKQGESPTEESDGVGDGDGDQEGQGGSPAEESDDNRYSDPKQDLTAQEAPDFGPKVLRFSPERSAQAMQAEADAVFAEQETAQMGTGRYAILLSPGFYDLDINVGYYTDVRGLGMHPDEVTVTGAVRSEADWFGGNSTHNFWRAAENMRVIPTTEPGVNRWAVSQAAPFRRMHIQGNLVLSDGGWSSGGFIADSVVDGVINSGSQQQWFTRSSRMGSWEGAVWNMFFLGMSEQRDAFWPPYTFLPEVPRLREKPYLFQNEVGNFYVHVPALRSNTHGPSWETGETQGRSIAIEEFYLAFPDRDDAASINAQLAAGKNLLLTPGVYALSAPLVVQQAGTVVMGLGLPSLRSMAGNAVLEVADVDGVKIAGITIDAGLTDTPTLMRVGPEDSSRRHRDNPTSIHDVFCRVGGGFPGQASGCMHINSHDVLGDHFWLWRADHGNGVGWYENLSKNGLVVRGDDVILYGLFVEHFHEYQTLWEGEGGRVFFYQCEMPYDPPSQAAWQNGDKNGYAGYKVADSVTTHEAWGLGVYAVFHDAPVAATEAIEVPEGGDVRMHHMVIRSLGGNGGSIESVINGVGGPANDETLGAEVAHFPELAP